MKQISKLLVFFICSVSLFIACNKQKTVTDSENIQIAEYKTFHDTHSNKLCSSSISVEYPISGEKQYLDSVRLWIDNVLCFNPFAEDNKISAFKGNKDDGQSLVSYYLQEKMKNTSNSNDNQVMFSDGVMFESEDSIFVSFKNKYLTSFSYKNYCFMGGAHGSTTVYGLTFNNKTGQTYGWNMIKDKNKLFEYINDGLMEYFEVSTVEEMKEILILEQPSIPLPERSPYFTANGLMLQYQQYEIAPYSAGLPCVLITWSKCKDILIPEIAEMLDLMTDK